MKKRFAFILILILLLSITACSTRTETKYLPSEAIMEIGEDYVSRTVYTYDDAGFQKKLECYVNGDLNSTTTYEYDGWGSLETVTTVSGETTQVMDYSNFYEDGKVATQSVTLDGALYMEFSFRYDEDGNRIYQHQTTYQNGSIYHYEHHFLANGKIRSTNSIIPLPDGATSKTNTAYTYNEQGYVINVFTDQNDGERQTNVSTQYDECNKKISSIETETIGGETTTLSTSTFTHDGNVETETAIDGAGTFLYTKVTTYDDVGNTLSAETITDTMTMRNTFTYQALEIEKENHTNYLSAFATVSPYLVIVMGILVFLMIFIPPNVLGYKNRRQPTITIHATVVGKEQNMDNALYSGAYSRQGGGSYHLIFDTADGSRVALTVPRDDYYNTQPGTMGLLTYQGSKCEKFTPD